MLKQVFAGTLTVSTLFITSCTTTETLSKIKCKAAGDAVLATNTGELILEQRLVKFQPLEEDGRERATCTIKNDPPGYRWVSCGRDGNNYTTYNGKKLMKVEEAIANSIQHRGWSGACKVKL